MRLPAWIMVTGAPVADIIVVDIKEWANTANTKIALKVLFFIFKRPVITRQG